MAESLADLCASLNLDKEDHTPITITDDVETSFEGFHVSEIYYTYLDRSFI